MKKFIKTGIFILLFMTNISILLSQDQYWEELSTLKNPPSIPSVAAANGKLYVFSGTNGGTAPTWEYDPATNSWSEKARIPKSTFWSSAVEVGGKIYVMGGGNPYPGQNYNYIYDPIQDVWTKGADMPSPRMYHSAAVANGRIYVFGCQNGDANCEWYLDEYDPASDKWNRKADLLHNAAWYSAAVGYQNKVYRIAGGGSSANLTRDYFEIYDIATDSWSEMPPFQNRVHAPSGVVFKNYIWLFGGYSNAKYLDSIWLYNLEMQVWEQSLIRMPQPRSYHKAAVIGNCIYVYGGMNSEGELNGTLIRYCSSESSIPQVNNGEDLMSYAYPNPAGDYILLQYDETDQSGISLKVFDILGNEVNVNIENESKPGLIKLNTSSLNPGIYCIAASFRNKFIHARFEKLP